MNDQQKMGEMYQKDAEMMKETYDREMKVQQDQFLKNEKNF